MDDELSTGTEDVKKDTPPEQSSKKEKIWITEGCYLVIFGKMTRKEATEFLKQLKDSKSNGEWTDDTSTKELNKLTSQLHRAKA